MKNLITTFIAMAAIVSFVSSVSNAENSSNLRPEPIGAVPPSTALIDCLFLTPDGAQDYSDLYVIQTAEKKGDLVLVPNPKWKDSGMSIIRYTGVDLEVTTKTVNLSANLMTMGGVLPIKYTMKRNKAEQLFKFHRALAILCSVK